MEWGINLILSKFFKQNKASTSLKNHVLLFVFAATVITLPINTSLIFNSIENHFLEQDVEELRVITKSIKDIINKYNRPSEVKKIRTALPLAVSGHHGVHYQVENAQGTLLYRSESANFKKNSKPKTPVKKIKSDNLFSWDDNEKNFNGTLVITKNDSDTYFIYAAIESSSHVIFLENVRERLWLIMIGTSLIALLATWMGIYHGLLPIRNLSKKMRDIQANHLDVRIATETVPTEMLKLVKSFNYMLSQLEDGFVKLSNFSADIAHELRTPLTNIITQTQVTLRQTRTPDAYRESMYSSLEELDRLTKMVGDMLWLANSDAELIQPVLLPLDLAKEVQKLFDFFEALADESQIYLSLVGSKPIVFGDSDLLRRALSNLLSNAIQHTPLNGSIEINISPPSEGTIELTIQNPGDTIPPEHLPRLFNRFYRVDPSRRRRSDGVGLGLAITESIIKAHGGDISVTSDNRSTCFKVRLPCRSELSLV